MARVHCIRLAQMAQGTCMSHAQPWQTQRLPPCSCRRTPSLPLTCPLPLPGQVPRQPARAAGGPDWRHLLRALWRQPVDAGGADAEAAHHGALLAVHPPPAPRRTRGAGARRVRWVRVPARVARRLPQRPCACAPAPRQRVTEPCCPPSCLPQVSWCKLEVEVDSHKAVCASPADNKCARGRRLHAGTLRACSGQSFEQPCCRRQCWDAAAAARLDDVPRPAACPAGRRRR